MAVPKKKTSKARTTRRFKSFAQKVKHDLAGRVQIVTCPQCKAPKQNHCACPSCGTYRGRQVIDMQKGIEKITKIKA